MKKYYYNDGKEQHGPFTLDELKAQGINRNTPVWYEGLPQWTEAGKISEIASYFPPSISSSLPPIPSPTQRPQKRNYTVLYTVIAIIVFGFTYVFIHDWILSERIEVREETEQNLLEGSIELNSTEPVGTTSTGFKKEPKSTEVTSNQDELENAEKNQIYNNFKSYFTVKVAGANIHAFGGMSEVFLEAKNLTKYTCQEMHIHINYIKENGEIWKQESMTINDLNPFETRKIQAPGSHRGSGVKAMIDFVVCSELGLSEGYGAE
jgi:hypothetical protein